MEAWQRLYMIAKRQHGVVTAAQAERCGVPARTWRKRVAEEHWVRPYPGVAAVPGAPATFERSAMAAALAIGPPVAVTGEAAAYLYRIVDEPPEQIDILIPLHRRAPSLENIAASRTGSLSDRDIKHARSIPVTTPERTMCHLARDRRSADGLRPLVIDAVQRRCTTQAAIAATHRALRPYPGSAAVNVVLRQIDENRADSELEFAARRWLQRAGFHPAPGPVPVTVPGGRVVHVDIGFPPLPVGIEVDGRIAHTGQRQIAKDHRRQNALIAVGYRVLRITWLRMDRDWDGFLAELRWTLDHAAKVTGTLPS